MEVCMHIGIIGLVGLVAGLVPYLAVAQEGADPRALDACRATSETFVQIEECLPEAHVGFKVIDKFKEIYPAEALPLAAKCGELNDRPAAVAACITNAIEAALSLSASLPAGSSLNDPVFDSVNSPELLDQLQAAIEEARSEFPNRRAWGGAGLYYTYR
jgi:hypothetical protein